MKTPFSKSNPDANPVRDILGIVAERAHHHWKFLPASTRAYYDVDDLISDCVLQVLTSAHKYNPDRARPTTFIWWVANNCCLTIRAKTQTVKRGGGVILTSLSPFLEEQYETYADFQPSQPITKDPLTMPETLHTDMIDPNLERVLTAKGSVESLISHASRECRDFLEALLLGHREALRNRRGIEEELTWLIKEIDLPANSFELVREYLAAC